MTLQPDKIPWFHLRWRRGMGVVDTLEFALIVLMQAAFIGAAVLAVIDGAWRTAFLSVMGLLVAWLPAALARNSRVRAPLEFEFLLNVFVCGALFLGEIEGFYAKFWWWDVALHLSSGLALGFVAFLILFSLYRADRVRASPTLIAVFSFTFAVALGAVWEIFEFAMDQLFGTNMQKSGLMDTMGDLISAAIGALVVAASGFVYLKFHTAGIGVFRHFLNAYLARQKGRKGGA